MAFESQKIKDMTWWLHNKWPVQGLIQHPLVLYCQQLFSATQDPLIKSILGSSCGNMFHFLKPRLTIYIVRQQYYFHAKFYLHVFLSVIKQPNQPQD